MLIYFRSILPVKQGPGELNNNNGNNKVAVAVAPAPPPLSSMACVPRAHVVSSVALATVWGDYGCLHGTEGGFRCLAQSSPRTTAGSPLTRMLQPTWLWWVPDGTFLLPPLQRQDRWTQMGCVPPAAPSPPFPTQPPPPTPPTPGWATVIRRHSWTGWEQLPPWVLLRRDVTADTGPGSGSLGRWALGPEATEPRQSESACRCCLLWAVWP